ncbi:MAG: ABC transporter permease subunit [Candidatus Eisenbacteria bacterium]|uniref:ABC transporter permease subunit n=1 Tax=Eiseniibacteriota bacterium TaxID=2212470 RepID=A0A7Y2H237_UNCEI|nr:ABC transporter permease subunit [Candidatus Eisenbacteria bacterium]
MTRTSPRLIGCLLVLWAIAISAPAGLQAQSVSVGSKNFSESRLLAEMFAQLIEAKTELEVERRLGLAGTQVCFEAIKNGAIDIYPEYTGTGLVTILSEPAELDRAETLNRVRQQFLTRWDLWWLAPLGFENAYEIAVPRALADERNLRTISDLAKVSQDLTAGFGYEFVGREDGLLGLESVYGLKFGSVKTMQQALKYQAAGSGDIECLDVYTTDGRLVVHDLVVLDDDQGFFPPYEAAALVRGETLKEYPELGNVLGLLSSSLTEDAVRGLNLRIENEGESVEAVAASALESLGLVVGKAVTGNTLDKNANLFQVMSANRADLLNRFWEHLALSGLALGLGILVAIPIGMFLEKHRSVAEGTIRVIGTTQTIPSIALLAFMIPLFGVGVLPAVIALWIYSIFPILRNTYTGLRDASPEAASAALALGMTEDQIRKKVRMPLAAPVIMAGIRTAAVITVGTATLAAFIGAGGLGVPIVSGLQMASPTIILSGALPAALLALLVDALLGILEKKLRPPGYEV